MLFCEQASSTPNKTQCEVHTGYTVCTNDTLKRTPEVCGTAAGMCRYNTKCDKTN